jgi:DNA-directed RNA polymerase subunit RPC12/RpoP
MKGFSLQCERCGSAQLRKSRRQSAGDILASLRGKSPIRCVDCGHRFMTNLLQFEKLPFARCPKCFNLKLEVAQIKTYHHNTLTRSVMLLLGAHRYRCPSCRYNFLSFRFQDPDTIQTPDDPDANTRARAAGSP